MIGIFGGTFDPVHLGHIQPVLDVKDALSLQQLRFVPCSVPAHRNTPVASTTQRLAMLSAAIDGQSDCVVDERELNRQGVSYMVDTLASFKKESPNEKFCFIVGMDAFLGLHHWSRWHSLFDYAHCVVTFRPGSELNMDFLNSELKQLVNDRQVQSVENFMVNSSANNKEFKILFLPVTQLDISASAIRTLIKQEKSIEDLVPVRVNNIIQQQQLYI